MTDEILLESRRDLRERAFQALMALEYDGDIVEACRFAYLHDKDLAEDKEVDLPAFLMNLVTGVYQSKDQLDQQIGQHLIQATVQKKNLNKRLSKLFQLNTCTKWMIQPTS